MKRYIDIGLIQGKKKKVLEFVFTHKIFEQILGIIFHFHHSG